MALTKVSGEVITRPLVFTGNASVSGIMTVGTGSTTTTIDGSQDFPIIRPTLDLNFAATKTLDRRITFTRDSIGTYTDELGIIQTVPNNVPRFDHDPVTGESLGLLIEESRTNLFTNSQLFNFNWTNIRSSESGTTATADPEGFTTGAAFKLVANTDNNTHRLDKTGLSMSVSTTYTMSLWAKAAEYTGVSLTIADSSNAFHGIYFDLSNGTFTNGGNAHSGSMIEYPNGWYRCIATYTTPSSISFQQCLIGVLEDGTTKSYTGDNSSGIYIWGAQLEEGSFPTSYIPTSGSTATRAADFAKITGTNFTDFYNSSEGTLFAESSFADLTTANQATVQLWYSSTEHIGMGYRWGGSGSGTYGFYIRNTADQLYRAPSGVTSNTFVKSSLAYKSNNGASSLNGETAVFDDSINLPTAATEMTIGYGNQSSSYRMKQGHIKQLTYYNKRLPNAQLQSLTRQ